MEVPLARPIVSGLTGTAALIAVAVARDVGVKDIGMLAAIGLVAAGVLLMMVAGIYQWVIRPTSTDDVGRGLEAMQRMTWIEQGGIDLRASRDKRD